MTIRTRLTLWYAGVLFVSLLLFGTASYYELVIERRHLVRHRVHPPSPSVPEIGRIAVDAREERWIMSEIGEILLWVAIPATLFGLAGGAFLTRKVLAPISTLTRTVERISEYNLSERLKASGNGDELDRLTDLFNAMLSRLENSFQRIREFTLHASHELKTPLTIFHAELETALADESVQPEQRERLQNQLNEVQRLARIVDGLTLLTKADAGLVTLARTPLNLDELVHETFADAQILAQPSQIHVTLTECEPSRVLGDRHRLRQLLLNLTDNAVKYNTPDGRVVMSLRHDGTMAEYSISNTGPGIPEADRQRVYERFFRSRLTSENAVDGCGLGLSIVHWIVLAHGGTIHLLNGPENVTIFSVRLPLAPQQAVS